MLYFLVSVVALAQRLHGGLLSPSVVAGSPVGDVRCSAASGRGYVWLGSLKGGLCRWDGYDLVPLRSDQKNPNLLRSNDVICVAADAGGTVYFGTKNGAYRLRTDSMAVAPLLVEGAGDGGRELMDKRISCMVAAADGTLWVAYRNQVLHVSKGLKLIKRYTTRWGRRDRSAIAMLELRGDMYVGLWNGGVCRLAKGGEGFVQLSWDRGDYPTAIAPADDGKGVMVGTNAGEVVCAAVDGDLTVRHSFTAIPGEDIIGIETDRRAGRIDVCSYRTAASFRRHGTEYKRVYGDVEPLSPSDAVSGGARLRIARLAAWTELLGEPVLSWAVDPEGREYAGTFNDIYRRDKAADAPYKYVTGIGRVHDIAVSKGGDIFFVSNGKGLCRLSGGKAQTLAADKSLCCMAIDNDSVIWAGGNLGQVIRYSMARKHCDEDSVAGNANGDAVRSVSVDAAGHLWVLSGNYVKEYSPSSHGFRLVESRQKGVEATAFKAMYASGGGAIVGAATCLYFVAHQPAMDKGGRGLKVCATYYEVDGKRTVLSSDRCAIHLERKAKSLRLGLSTFEYERLGKIRIAYCVDDTLGEWTYMPEGQSTIELLSLPGGVSRLYMKAMDAYGRWGEAREVVTIDRDSAWYESALLYVLAFGLLAAGAFAFFIQRKRSIKPEVEQTAGPEPESPTEEPGQAEDEAVPVLSPADKEFVDGVKAFIEKNIDNADYSVDALSGDMLMSRMHLYRRVRETTGQTPVELIRNMRLERAAELLRGSSRSVNEVADLVGFSYANYFARCFKEKYGVSPKDYSAGQGAK